MSDSLQRYQDLKKRADNAKSKAERAQAICDDRMEQLHEDFGCATIAQAKTKLKKMGRACDAAEEELQDAMSEFEKNWNEYLED